MRAKPYVLDSTHRISLFNEISVSLYLLLMLILTEPFPMQPEMKEKLGWALAFLITGVVLVNLCKVIFMIFDIMRLKLRLWYRGIKVLEVDEVVKLRPMAEIRRMSTAASFMDSPSKNEEEKNGCFEVSPN
jgi:hypothetical protein